MLQNPIFVLYVLLVWTYVFLGTWFLTPRINNRWRMKIDDPTQALVMAAGEVTAEVCALGIILLTLSPFLGFLAMDSLDLLVSVVGLLAIYVFTFYRCPKTLSRFPDIDDNAAVS